VLGQATVTIDLGAVRDNTRAVVEALPGVEIVGVTKVTCGTPDVARAMLAGGAVALGESRLENAARLREAGITAPIWLIRAPTPDLADDTVRLTDVSLQSEAGTVQALDRACERAGTRHSIVVMIDVGDLREGLMPDALPGANLTCYGAIVPDERNLGLLANLAEAAGSTLGRRMLVSGGSSTSIAIVLAGRAPAALDNLRIGEAILLGVDPATREPIPGLPLRRDAIVLSAPVIEVAVKPSLPIGNAAQDAFGATPAFEDLGLRRRAILAIGRQDVAPEDIVPLDPGVRVLGASSDHLVLDVHDMVVTPEVGDAISFVPGYSATLRLSTSPYVAKVMSGEPC
jgi:predicted amino acid racemase